MVAREHVKSSKEEGVRGENARVAFLDARKRLRRLCRKDMVAQVGEGKESLFLEVRRWRR